VALDRNRRGLARLRAEAERLGVDVLVAQADARHPPTARRFDAVLVDAPCSGFGTLRRHPELKWRRHPDDIPRLAALQLDVAGAAADLVRPGGLLVYAVCTRAGRTTDVIAALSRRIRGSSEAGVGQASMPTACSARRRTHGLDGFFAARLRARA
jgi:16S rRNA (cytosine967-C5)-methyltransferase